MIFCSPCHGSHGWLLLRYHPVRFCFGVISRKHEWKDCPGPWMDHAYVLDAFVMRYDYSNLQGCRKAKCDSAVLAQPTCQ